MKNLNWPNRLSLMRILSVPVITVLILLSKYTWVRYVSLFLFIFASITDFVDGWMARKYNIVTNFGKFIDPVADKLLVLSTMVMLCWAEPANGMEWYLQLPAWLVVAVLFRELAVDGLRLVAVEQGKVIAAGKLGKIKTICQMVMLIAHLVYFAGFPFFKYIACWLIIPAEIAVLVMTLWSGVDYFLRNKEVLNG